MKKRFSVLKEPDGSWVTRPAGSSSRAKKYHTKAEAVSAARNIAKKGATVIVHGANGEIQKVIGVRSQSSSPIREARVKHRRSNDDVNIAIAKVLESSKN